MKRHHNYKHGKWTRQNYCIECKTKTWRFLDVAVPELMLDFEYNGLQHKFKKNQYSDKIRLKELNRLGWKVIIIDKDNYNQLNNILRKIKL